MMTGSRNNTDEVLIRQEAIREVRDRLTSDYSDFMEYCGDYWYGYKDAYDSIIEYLDSVIDEAWQEECSEMNIEYVSDATTNFNDLDIGDVFSVHSVVYMKIIDVINMNCVTWRYNAVRLEDGVLEYFIDVDVIPLNADLAVRRMDK